MEQTFKSLQKETIWTCLKMFFSQLLFVSPLHNCSISWFECCAVLVTQLCLTLCNPMDYSAWGSSVHGISHIRILEWDAISSSRGSSWSRDWTRVSCISFTVSRFFTSVPIPGLKTSHYGNGEHSQKKGLWWGSTGTLWNKGASRCSSSHSCRTSWVPLCSLVCVSSQQPSTSCNKCSSSA